MSKFKYGDKVYVRHNGRKGVVVSCKNDDAYNVAFDETGNLFAYLGTELTESADNRVKATVWLEVSEPYKGRWPDFDRPASGKVWIDTTFDDCKLQSVLIYSGDLRSAQSIYDGRLRLTADSRLVASDSGEVRP